MTRGADGGNHPAMTAEDNAALGRIRRERRWLLAWAISAAPALWTAWRTPHRWLAVAAVGLIWTAGVALSLARLLFAHCPRCGRLFHSADGMPSVAKIFAPRCGQCGLRLKPERIIYPSLE